MAERLNERDLYSSPGNPGLFDFSRNTLLKLIKNGEFPQPRRRGRLKDWDPAVIEHYREQLRLAALADAEAAARKVIESAARSKVQA